MSQSKAQITSPLGTVNITGGINASGVVTSTSFIGDGTSLTGVALTGNINTTGIITAGSYSGDGSNLDGVGIGTEDSINTTGIITASKFSGDGSLLTGIGGPLTPLVYSPGIGETNVGFNTSIVLTFNKPIVASAGTITLRENAADGTIVESFTVTTSDRLTINGAQLTIDPTDDVGAGKTFYVVLPAGAYDDTYGIDSSEAITNYYYESRNVTNEVFYWGPGGYGTGLDDNITRSSPTQVPGTNWDSGKKSIGKNDYETHLLKRDGTLWGWGDNGNGTLGVNDTQKRSSPTQIPGTEWSQITGGYTHSGCLKSDGTLWTWGENSQGNLGHNDRIAYSSPRQVPGTQWAAVAGGRRGFIGTKTDGTLWSWGQSSYGENGYGLSSTGASRSSPVQIPGTEWTTDFNKISFSYHDAKCFKTDGTLWVWGRNNYGKLGLNNTVQRSSPVQLPGTQWSHLALDYQSSGAIKTDGTLWMWGSNSTYGRLGNNQVNTAYSSPIQIPGTAWDGISLGRNAAALATKTDGTLWAWGGNVYGSLGDNSVVQRSSPTQIPGTNWDRIAAAQNVTHTSYATKTDGTLWAWGRNNYGQLGRNNKAEYSSPVQIPGTSWAGIKAGYRYVVARKTDNTIWAWGLNENGELGVNDILYYSSPTQVPGTQWGKADTTDTQGLGAGQYMTWCLQQP